MDDRPAQEVVIEITPEMIEAGRSALCGFDLVVEPLGELEAKVAAVFQAMSRASINFDAVGLKSCL